jgi:hypothetical protein
VDKLSSALTYAPPFLVVVRLKGFQVYSSMLNSIPHSFYVFMFCCVPAIAFADPLIDKLIISLLMFLVLASTFPYSVLTLLVAVARYTLWANEVLRLRKLIMLQIPATVAAEHPLL